VSTGTYLLYATWQPISYTISYNASGATAVAPTQSALHYGDSFSVGSSLTRNGYDFAGWNDGSQTYGPGAQYSVGLSNISFTAVWVPHVYTIGFDWNGGSGTAVANRSYTVGSTGIALPGITNQVRDGYVFAGWALTQNGALLASPYVPTGTGTLYAVWSTGSYTVNFDSQLGTLAQTSVAVANGASQSLPTPTRSNFVFLGWFTAPNGGTLVGQAGANYTPSASGTLFAHWVQSSLYGIAPGNLTRIGTINALQLVGSNYSGTSGSSSVSVNVPAGALPTGTVVGIDLIADNSYAQSLINGNNTYVLSVAVSWLASDGTVPNTNTGKSVSLTISNPSIRAGALVYSIQNGVATLLGTATADGTVTVELTSDPGIYVVQTVSSAPRTLTGVAGQSSITFTWAAPVTDGGSAITGYTITLNDGSTCSTTGALTCTISNLTQGTTYNAQLTATNGVGTSVAATASVLTTSPVIVPPVVVVPKKAPTAPTTIFVGNNGNKITVTWSAPNDNGGSAITGYIVSGTGGLGCETTALSCIFIGQAGVVYSFSVVAVNEIGTGAVGESRAFALPGATAPKPVVVEVSVPTAIVTVNPISGVPVLTGVAVTGAIRFNADSAKLDAVDRAAIASAAKAVRGKAGVLLVTGFVKASGASRSAQLKLATARAKAVATALAKLGVTVKLGYVGFGAANKLNPTVKDRKVEIRWVANK
jgi:outer membrane protein OmpA-like peptidoglycan-associated protein